MFDIEFTRLERQSDSYFYWHMWDKDGTEYYVSDSRGYVSLDILPDYECIHIVDNPLENEFRPLTTKEMLNCLGAVYEDLPIELESDI